MKKIFLLIALFISIDCGANSAPVSQYIEIPNDYVARAKSLGMVVYKEIAGNRHYVTCAQIDNHPNEFILRLPCVVVSDTLLTTI